MKIQPRSLSIFTHMTAPVKLYLEYTCVVCQITYQNLLFLKSTKPQ